MLIQFIKFCVVGASGMAVDFGITFLGKEKLRLNKYVANSLGFISAASTNYVLNRLWTFHSRDPQVAQQYMQFIGISAIGLLINNLIIYLQLFLSYLKIGFFGFGGGYAMLSLIQHEVVIAHGWITNEELTDIIAVSQMTPGPISINSATYIGYVVTGSVWGAVVATAAVCLPAMTLMIVLTRFYLALRNNAYIRGVMYGMRPMILAMIALAGAVLFTPVTFIDYKSWLIFGAVFLASLRKIDPILLIVLSGVAGYLIYG